MTTASRQATSPDSGVALDVLEHVHRIVDPQLVLVHAHALRARQPEHRLLHLVVQRESRGVEDARQQLARRQHGAHLLELASRGS